MCKKSLKNHRWNKLPWLFFSLRFATTKNCERCIFWKGSIFSMSKKHFLKEKYFTACTNTLGKSKKNFGTKIFFLGREKNSRINVLFEPCHPVYFKKSMNEIFRNFSLCKKKSCKISETPTKKKSTKICTHEERLLQIYIYVYNN